MDAEPTTDATPTTWPSDPAERGRAMAAAGVIGGRQPGAGRPRRDRFSRLIAEAMEEHVDEVVAALRAGLVDANTRTRVMAARAAVDLAVRHDAVAQRDDHHDLDRLDHYASMTADELRAAFARELTNAVRTGEVTLGELQAQLGAPVVDADVVE